MVAEQADERGHHENAAANTAEGTKQSGSKADENGEQNEFQNDDGSAVSCGRFSCGGDFDNEPMQNEAVIEAGGDQ